jgi:8-amino-7-oxononanoate synthase
MSLPPSLQVALHKRKEEGLLRSLSLPKAIGTGDLIDFCSNDYLGFARSEELHAWTQQKMPLYGRFNGSTGSRLISGNSEAIEELEKKIAAFHNAEAALIFNSGYDANIGLLSCVGKKDDLFLYDELVHASLHDGMRLSHATAYKFRHNDVQDLRRLLSNNKLAGTVYVVLESVYSMDGDSAPLQEIAALRKELPFELIVDEAHATGVFGRQGSGLCNELGLEQDCFARIYTYGKAMGVHGAAVAGSSDLRSYLINFSRSFIYTTALSPHAYAAIDASYTLLQTTQAMQQLKQRISEFRSQVKGPHVLASTSAIQVVLIPGNKEVAAASALLRGKGLDVRSIKSPTVKAGTERLRICLHSYNTPAELQLLHNVLGFADA